MFSMYDQQHMEDILSGHGDWFHAQLARLIAKADEINIERLREGFPNEVAFYEAWYYGDAVQNDISPLRGL